MSSRRDFIKKTSLGLAALTIPTSIFSQEDVDNIAGKGLNKFGIMPGEKVKIKVAKPLFCPYHSVDDVGDKGGNTYYYKSVAFDHNPFTIKASGMSGSPIVMDANGKLIGFMTTFGYEFSTFSFDGNETLTVNVPAGQELFIDENGDGEKAWKAYNAVMMERLNIKPITNTPKFWSDVEYCTWMEQKYYAKKKNEHFELLTHDFLKKYLDDIIALGYPKGKLTLDHGWATFPNGSVDSGFGSWVPDPKKFPNFRKTMDLISNKGFTPGLWIGFPKIQKDSLGAKFNPDLLGNWDVNDTEFKADAVRYLNPKSDIFEYASETIDRFYKMGVRKFKIDMSYNAKSDMLHIHKELYRAAKLIDKDIEMEFHVPDIFFTKYTDVIRTNDVWINDKMDWKARVKTHYEISMKSSPGRMINLDHIGGNDIPGLTEERFLQHLEMYKAKIGYPCVSLLPNHISQKCADETRKYLWDYTKSNRKIISDFY